MATSLSLCWCCVPGRSALSGKQPQTVELLGRRQTVEHPRFRRDQVRGADGRWRLPSNRVDSPLSLSFIDGQEERFARAFAAGDITLARDLYHSDVVYLSPTTRLFGRPPRIEGVEATLEFIQLTIAGCDNIGYRLDERAVLPGSSSAYTRIIFDWDDAWHPIPVDLRGGLPLPGGPYRPAGAVLRPQWPVGALGELRTLRAAARAAHRDLRPHCRTNAMISRRAGPAWRAVPGPPSRGEQVDKPSP